MEPPAVPDDRTLPEDDPAVAPATVVDLTAGAAQITPVVVDGESRFEVDLPDQPLAEEDVESLAVALHVAQSGPAVLVDVEEYVDLDPAAGDGPDDEM